MRRGSCQPDRMNITSFRGRRAKCTPRCPCLSVSRLCSAQARTYRSCPCCALSCCPVSAGVSARIPLSPDSHTLLRNFEPKAACVRKCVSSKAAKRQAWARLTVVQSRRSGRAVLACTDRGVDLLLFGALHKVVQDAACYDLSRRLVELLIRAVLEAPARRQCVRGPRERTRRKASQRGERAATYLQRPFSRPKAFSTTTRPVSRHAFKARSFASDVR